MNTATLSNIHLSEEQMSATAQEWNDLEVALRPYIQKCVYALHTARWLGAEKEIAEDVLSETMLRVIQYTRLHANDTNFRTRSIEALCKTIAKRYLLDLRRKDKHLIASLDTTMHFIVEEKSEMADDPAEYVTKGMDMYSKILLIAQAVKDFPQKQKEAMLIHLANMTDFDDEQPGLLERAMWSVDISLREYRREINTPVLRSRHTALVCLAYKQLRQRMADDSYENTRIPSQTEPTTSMDERNNASNKRERAMDIASRDETNTAQVDELSCVNQLHEPYQQAVREHCIEKWSYLETAARMGLPVGTVKSLVSRGLKLLHTRTQHNDTQTNDEAEQKQKEVLTNLHKLEGPCRRAVQLHYLEGRSYPEIATELQVPVNTAKSYVHRGMKVLCA